MIGRRPASPAAEPPAFLAMENPLVPAGSLVTAEQEARAFWRMRARYSVTVLGQLLARARFRFSLVAALTVVLWSTLFWLFFEAFRFLKTTISAPDLHDDTVQIVFGAFFITLMVMLVFSAGIILYGTLFRGRDIPLLLTLPASEERVFLSKFQEAILMSSWAFLLLGSPMLLAYGITNEAPWYYFAMLLPFLVAFTYVPAAVGAVICLVVVYRLPSLRLHVVAVVGLGLVLGGLLIFWYLTSGPENNLLTARWFQEMLDRLRITQHRLLPSWWLSAGLFQAARRNASESILFLGLMISNALFSRQVAIWTSSALYRRAFSRLFGCRTARASTKVFWMDRLVVRLSVFVPHQSRLLMVKDLRLFRRDPVQWSQLLIFTGLLSLYFVNIRRFHYDVYYVSWVNLVSFLNVSVVGLLLSTFTTRFVFPMISLEGRRFWILGLLPIHRDMILWSKFLFAVGASIVPSSLLILLSDTMLQVAPFVFISHQITCLILCCGLSGIAVGLGAKLPSLREQSPSRIAAGFGGTLNLVLSTLYILTIVVLTAVPCHFYFATLPSGSGGSWIPVATFHSWIAFWFYMGMIASVIVGAVATVAPLVVGIRAFRKIEF